jgi:hypothetical protein
MWYRQRQIEKEQKKEARERGKYFVREWGADNYFKTDYSERGQSAFSMMITISLPSLLDFLLSGWADRVLPVFASRGRS